jgi:hypothetical protein
VDIKDYETDEETKEFAYEVREKERGRTVHGRLVETCFADSIPNQAS